MTQDADAPEPADDPSAGSRFEDPQKERPAEQSRRRPVLRLKPKCGGRFFAGAPWVYANELVLDRRSKALAPGTIVELQDSERRPVAVAAANTGSQIAARALDRDPEAEIDADWLAAKLSSALALRDRLFDKPFYRLVHAEADGLPGLVIDRFGDALAIQPNAAWLETTRAALLAALDRVLAPKQVLWSGSSRARKLEGLEPSTLLLKGAIDGPIEVPMNGAIYLADLVEGQKTGLFYDQRPNQAFIAGLSQGRSLLDVFSHVGGFSLAALAAGAERAMAVDGSEPALALAGEGARRMGASDRLETRKADAFDAMRALRGEGRVFDVVVCDPPAFAPNKGALEAGLRAYGKTARFGAALTAPGGIFCLCSCSHAVSSAMLEETAARAFRALRREARLIRRGGAGPDHPIHPHLGETEYLKALFYAMD